MYGLVNKAIEDLVVTTFGTDKWQAIRAKAGVEVAVFISNESYPDEITYSLVEAAAEVLAIPAEDILTTFGEHWVLNTAARSYSPMMKSCGNTLGEFLVNLPNFHTRVAMIFPDLKPPRFTCTEVSDHGMQMHYFSHRPGLAPFVTGLLQGLGSLFNTPCTVTVVQRKDQGADHDVFQITW